MTDPHAAGRALATPRIFLQEMIRGVACSSALGVSDSAPADSPERCASVSRRVRRADRIAMTQDARFARRTLHEARTSSVFQPPTPNLQPPDSMIAPIMTRRTTFILFALLSTSIARAADAPVTISEAKRDG